MQPGPQQSITAAQSFWKISLQSRNEAASILKALGGQIPCGENSHEANGILKESELIYQRPQKQNLEKYLHTIADFDYITA